MSTGDWLARREALTPEQIALIDTDNANAQISYRAWNRAANQTAHLLAELGIGKGERVAVLAHNSVRYLDIWFACGKLGAIMQPLNWRLTAHELAALLADATPCVLLYGAEFAGLVGQLRERWPGPCQFVALDARADSGDLAFRSREQLSDAPPPAVDIQPNDPWVICYTGGSTGLPKGAILTHKAITWNAINTIVSWELSASDVTILCSPLFHTGGLNVFTAPFVQAGGRSIVCRSFDVDLVFDLIEQAGVTVFFGVPTMFIAMQQHPRWQNADFSRLRWVVSGGAPCPLPVFERFWARNVEFKTGYGLTEAGPNTFWLPSADVQRKPGAVGAPLFHVDVRLARPDGSMCEDDEAGELQIHGPHVCAGYWNRPEDTARTIVDGWLHTGDLAVRDTDGHYTIVGRIKDVIISGGENIYPAEIENVLAAHPAVAEAALIAVPDERWGEVGRALLVLKPGYEPDSTHILSFCGERLARFKLPKSIVFLEELPRTGAGKVDKQLLREQHG